MSAADFRPFAGYDDIYDRSIASGERERVWLREGRIAQAGEMNEALSIEARKRTTIGNLVARDGDRQSGADIAVDIDAGTVSLAAGRIYLRGDVRSVEAATLSGVPMAGDVSVGVRVASAIVTHEDDPTLLGLHPGSLAEGEDGAVRETVLLSWGHSADGADGELCAVYLLHDGFVVDQTAPSNLSGFAAFLAPVTYGANGNYVEGGCVVTPVGTGDGRQWFSIGEGVASILGYRRTRLTSSRHGEPILADIRSVTTEPHIFADAGTGTAAIRTNRGPINSVAALVITRQSTQTIVRGGVANTSDLLPNESVSALVEVKQVGTTFVSGSDYVLTGNRVDWAPGGAEPAGGSSYDVTFRYLDPVAPDEVGQDTVTVSGGVTGTAVLISYAYKLPRHDRICLDSAGQIVYLRGVPAIEQPQPPETPKTLLSLAVVRNDWRGQPQVENDGVRSIPFELQWRYFRRLVDLVDLVALERLRASIALREPVAKHGVFVDPLTSDRYRDAGEAQSGAVFDGTLQLPIAPSFHAMRLGGIQTLNFSEETVVAQDYVTGCTPINPYQSFDRLPAVMALSPATDFWTESEDVWLSPDTQVFGRGNQGRVVESTIVTTLTEGSARFLRQIAVGFSIDGFAPHEPLEALTFDGIDVTPAGPPLADANGRVTGSFTIPAGVASGTKLVAARGGSGMPAAARFTGEGRIETTTRQRIDTMRRFDSASGMREGGDRADPVAQSFTLTAGRHVSSVDLRFCAIGNRIEPVIVELVDVDNGYPSASVIAQAEIDMHGVVVGTWHRIAFAALPYVAAGQDVAIVVKTNDPVHAIAFAARGGYDEIRREVVGAQPYTVGVRFSSSNARAWTAHQDEDLTFRINCARFAPVTKVVPIGLVAVTDVSDIIVECQAQLPTGAARLLIEIEPEGEQAIRAEPGQVLERQSYFTGNIALRAVLTGSETVSPVMGPDVLAIMGKIATSGTYVSRAFDIGDDNRLNAVMATALPAGATLTVEHDGGGDDDWHAMSAGGVEALADGTFERTFTRSPAAGPAARLRLTLTGGPAARPAISSLRAWSVPA